MKNKKTWAIKQAEKRINEHASFAEKLAQAKWETNREVLKEHYGLELEPWESITDAELDELMAIEAEITQKVAPIFQKQAKVEVYSVNRRYNQANWVAQKDFV